MTAVALERPRLLSLPLVAVFLTSFGALTSFYLLLSVVPLYAPAGAGTATGLLMAGTVGAEFASARLAARFGYRALLGGGLVALGAPALALVGWRGPLAIAVVCVVRGLGFGAVMVAGGALIAILVPKERRGEGLGLYGIVAGIPGVVALPLGVWLVGHVGYRPVFVAGALTALAGLAVLPGVPAGRTDPEHRAGLGTALRTNGLLRPAVVFAATTVAAGAVVAFVPLAVGGRAAGLAPAALLAQALTATVSRWWAGRRGDRRGPGGLLAPAVLAVAAGVLLVSQTSDPVAVLAGVSLFGAGFGIAQNASLALMLNRVAEPGYGMVSALWNLAYDGGMGAGAAGFGALAGVSGYPLAFAAVAALVLVPAVLARRA